MKQQKLLAAILCAASPLSYAASGTFDEIVVASTRDVLRGVAGLTISRNGVAGKTTSVFLRGTNADHALVLIGEIKPSSGNERN